MVIIEILSVPIKVNSKKCIFGLRNVVISYELGIENKQQKVYGNLLKYYFAV